MIYSHRWPTREIPAIDHRNDEPCGWPTRLIPAIDHRNDDPSGVPSPLWSSNWGS